jgi:hypothetical protein
VDVLYGPGSVVTYSGTGWTALSTASLQTRLNTNFFSLPTTYGTGRIAYHGPYTLNIDSDPWGYTYLAEVGPAPGSTYAAYVLSAGPDGIVQTNKLQSPGSFTVGGDDIVVRIK